MRVDQSLPVAELALDLGPQHPHQAIAVPLADRDASGVGARRSRNDQESRRRAGPRPT